jgi:hypothetical protein
MGRYDHPRLHFLWWDIEHCLPERRQKLFGVVDASLHYRPYFTAEYLSCDVRVPFRLSISI